MNEQMMMQEGTWMMLCMIAIVIFVVIIGIAVIVQTFLQARILKELRRIDKNNNS